MTDTTYWLLMVVYGKGQGMVVGIYDNEKSAQDVCKKEMLRTSRRKCAFFVAKADPVYIEVLQKHNILTRDDPPQVAYEM